MGLMGFLLVFWLLAIALIVAFTMGASE